MILQDCTLFCMHFSDSAASAMPNLNFSIPYGTLHTRGLALMLCLLLWSYEQLTSREPFDTF